jgi:hypothetical protein
LSGLISQCVMPAVWSAASADAICAPIATSASISI